MEIAFNISAFSIDAIVGISGIWFGSHIAPRTPQSLLPPPHVAQLSLAGTKLISV
jgi:hypothetical protein